MDDFSKFMDCDQKQIKKKHNLLTPKKFLFKHKNEHT